MNDEKQILLCKMKGGSHSYGLNTPESDLDFRGVFLNRDLGSIIGIKSGINDNETRQTETEDAQYWELRKFFKMLRDGNTQAVELLYLGGEHSATSSFEYVDPTFVDILNNRVGLFDSNKLYKVLKGYSQGELKLANGERTGKLGGKRFAQVQKYGFSPKNFVQLFRLLWAGTWLYRTGLFPVNVRQFDPHFADFLMEVKTQPENFTKEQLNGFVPLYEGLLDSTFKDTSVNYQFEEDIANEICRKAYLPLLMK